MVTKTAWQAWEDAIVDRPDTFEIDKFHWTDTKTGWVIWIANGFWFYRFANKGAKIGFFERFRVGSALKKWAAGRFIHDGMDR